MCTSECTCFLSLKIIASEAKSTKSHEMDCYLGFQTDQDGNHAVLIDFEMLLHGE